MSNIFCDYHHHDEKIIQKEREYSRILTAAVVSERFRKQLLANPGLAIKNGFGGEAFHLNTEETSRISSIHVSTLAEFARQMNMISSRPVLASATLD
jgi:fatty acid desaturase